jgi:hypothetical protein
MLIHQLVNIFFCQFSKFSNYVDALCAPRTVSLLVVRKLVSNFGLNSCSFTLLLLATAQA